MPRRERSRDAGPMPAVWAVHEQVGIDRPCRCDPVMGSVLGHLQGARCTGMEHEMTIGAGPLGSGEDVMRDGERSTRTGELLGSEHQSASTTRHLLADAEFITTAHAAMPALLSAVESVLALHTKVDFRHADRSVTPICSHENCVWPCPTVKAITDAIGGE